MGSVVGERFVRGVGTAIEQKVPYICITSTGGARMQEGLLSLFQMAKTTAMIANLAEARLPFISVLADPTMGGVSASFAFMGDVVIAEPKALIGFAGPRVIEQTVREKLPEGFQRAEFLMTKGAIDMILDPYFTAHEIKPGPPVDDRVYARRVYLDIIGMLPSPQEVQAFVEALTFMKLVVRDQQAGKKTNDDERLAKAAHLLVQNTSDVPRIPPIEKVRAIVVRLAVLSLTIVSLTIVDITIRRG
jgi:hypothetical protein